MNDSFTPDSPTNVLGEATLTQLGGHNVLFAMAAEAEYGTHLRKRFDPLITGVGPVEAAVELTAALAALAQCGRLPDLVVSLGSAGSRVLEQTEIYQASSIAYRDMDASPLGFEKGATPFLDLPAILPLSLRVQCGYTSVRQITGGELKQRRQNYGRLPEDTTSSYHTVTALPEIRLPEARGELVYT